MNMLKTLFGSDIVDRAFSQALIYNAEDPTPEFALALVMQQLLERIEVLEKEVKELRDLGVDNEKLEEK
jgi:hypothetical protein